MGVPVASVAVGKCYLTEIGQVRRVLEIKEAMVKYESRGKTAHGGSWGSLTTVSSLRFARDVEREVPCDYDPRYPAGTQNPIDDQPQGGQGRRSGWRAHDPDHLPLASKVRTTAFGRAMLPR